MLVKDYITFYKRVDDKMPKDFLLLKDFTLFSSSQKNGFILYDKLKQREHEFYASSFDEYKQWYQSLIDLRIKLNTALQQQQQTSISMQSQVKCQSDELSRSLPVSLSFNNYKMNQPINAATSQIMTLTTIMDSQDDINENNINRNLDSPLSPFNINTSQLNSSTCQHYIGSSRETSPKNKMKNSRDNSPVLIYRLSYFLYSSLLN